MDRIGSQSRHACRSKAVIHTDLDEDEAGQVCNGSDLIASRSPSARTSNPVQSCATAIGPEVIIWLAVWRWTLSMLKSLMLLRKLKLCPGEGTAQIIASC